MIKIKNYSFQLLLLHVCTFTVYDLVFILQLCTFILGRAILSHSKFAQFVLNLHVDFMITEIRGGSMRRGSRGGWTPLRLKLSSH